ncbi:DUF6114 domain-containing protein [Saccharothrix sp. Mg75]|uniref:DUF6114 domain-containing protein n=1 Tax=Saccharothrix sp. Mg75 TaxID=3445357 RepID=UPI003EEA4ECE
MGSVRRRADRARRDFRDWRRGRPFAAGAFLVLSGLVIVIPPYATLRVGDVLVSVTTVGGVSALLIGTLLGICGASLWLRPRFRFAAGVTAMLLSLVALAATNLGGFLIGTLLGVVGAALALAWTDEPRPPRRARRAAAVVSLLAFAAGAAPLQARDVPPAAGWTLLAGAVELSGLAYHGVDHVQVDGRPARAMRFTAAVIRVTDPVQVGDLGNGRRVVLAVPHGGLSTAAGDIELFVLRITGRVSLLGLLSVPVDFTPDTPPPLVPTSVVLTDVTAVNALVRGGEVTIPGAELAVR